MRERGGRVALAGCLLVVGLISAAVPEFSPEATDLRAIRVGDWGTGDGFKTKVDSVALSYEVSKGQARVPAADGTLWVVVTWRVAALSRNVSFADVSLVTDRGTYARRSTNAVAGHILTEPGFTSRCTETFQVPAELVAEAALRPRPAGRSLIVYRAQVSVDLGIDRSTEVVQNVPVSPCTSEVTP